MTEAGAATALAPEGGMMLVLLRGLFVGMLLAGFGTALFRAAVLPRALARAEPAEAARVRTHLRRLALAEVAAALLLLPAWTLAQAADMADADTLADALGAVPAVLTGTQFGHLALTQAAVLLGGLALCWRDRPWPGAVALGAATALQAGHGHAWAMQRGSGLLLVAGVVHLLSAGGWIGGLPPLLLVVRSAPARVAAAAARWFSPLGKWCVGGVAGAAVYQAWRLIGGVSGFVGTAYGRVALVKLALFAVLTALAVLNRYRLAPALARGPERAAQRRLLASIAI